MFREHFINDLNDAIYPGMYYISYSGMPNAPSETVTGYMIVITPYKTATRGLQVFFSNYYNNNYKRLVTSPDGTTYEFGDWIQI